MERDCIISSGASKFLQEKLTMASDPLGVALCTKCGYVADVNFEKKTRDCKVCKTGEGVVWVKATSAAFITTLRELASMSIRIKINTKTIPGQWITNKSRIITTV